MPHGVGKVYEVFVGMLMTFIILQVVLLQTVAIGFFNWCFGGSELTVGVWFIAVKVLGAAKVRRKHD